MSEEAEQPIVEAKEKKPKKKCRLAHRIELRLREIISRRKFTDRVNYLAIAARHNCTVASLKRLWYRYNTLQEIELCDDSDLPEAQLIDGRADYERASRLMTNYKRLILDGIEAKMGVEKIAARDYRKLGLHFMFRDLYFLMALQSVHDKGYDALLENERAQRHALDKKLEGRVIPEETKTLILDTNEEDRMMKLLGGTTRDAAPETPKDEAAT